jgi:hypothetical protein
VSPKYHLLSNALWIAHPVLQSLVAAAMIRRKLYKTFPFFFAYVVAQMLIFAALYPIYSFMSCSLTCTGAPPQSACF